MTPRTTEQWQAADAAHFLHPFTDFKALAEKGSRIITRADNIYLWDSEGRKVLDAMSGLWCVNVGYGQTGAGRCRRTPDARAALLQRLLPDRHAAGDRVGRVAGRSDAAAVPARLLLGLGLRGQRHRGAHGAPLLGRAGPAAAPGHHQPPQRVSRLHDGRRVAGRHGRHACAGRAADPGHRAHRAALLLRARPAACPRTSSGSSPRAGWKRRSWKSGRRTWPRSSANRCRAPAA